MVTDKIKSFILFSLLLFPSCQEKETPGQPPITGRWELFSMEIESNINDMESMDYLVQELGMDYPEAEEFLNNFLEDKSPKDKQNIVFDPYEGNVWWYVTFGESTGGRYEMEENETRIRIFLREGGSATGETGEIMVLQIRELNRPYLTLSLFEEYTEDLTDNGQMENIRANYILHFRKPSSSN